MLLLENKDCSCISEAVMLEHGSCSDSQMPWPLVTCLKTALQSSDRHSHKCLSFSCKEYVTLWLMWVSSHLFSLYLFWTWFNATPIDKIIQKHHPCPKCSFSLTCSICKHRVNNLFQSQLVTLPNSVSQRNIKVVNLAVDTPSEICQNPQTPSSLQRTWWLSPTWGRPLP